MPRPQTVAPAAATTVSSSARTRSKRGTPPNIIDIVPGSQQHQLLSLRLLNDCQKYVFLLVSPRLTPSRITTQNFPMHRLVIEQRSVVISVLFYKFIHYLFGWLCVLGRKTLINSRDSFATTEKSIKASLWPQLTAQVIVKYV